eukprot:928103_1
MASLEHTQISKELLENIHRHQLTNGESNDAHQEAIIQTLGGIDDILQLLFTSNAVLDQMQLDSLHAIINNTSSKNQLQLQTTINQDNASSQQEDKTYHIYKTFTYTFKDEDSLLFTIFEQENANKILHALNSKI